jgi:hypothetical protein
VDREALAAAVLSSPLTLAVARDLAEAVGSLDDDDLDGLLRQALASGSSDATALALAARALSGEPPRARQLLDHLPAVRSGALVVTLAATCPDRSIDWFVDLVERGRMPPELGASLLYVAALQTEGEAPARLLAALRQLARRSLEPEGMCPVGLAALRLRDQGLLAVASECVRVAGSPLGADFERSVAGLLESGIEAALPERLPPRRSAGFTVRRPVAKVGRNDPCPCGSGRKYKKCCAGKEAERALDPSPVEGLTMAEYRQREHEFIAPHEVGRLPPARLAQLDFAQLDAMRLIAAFRGLIAGRRWADAERAMAELANRDDMRREGLVDGHRQDLLREALSANELAVVQRQRALLPDDYELPETVRLGIELLEERDPTLRAIEQIARRGLEDDASLDLVELAYTLLEHRPALGILVTRGVLTPERALDADMLLEVIEEVRDRLGLPPGDRAADIMAMLVDEEEQQLAESDAARRDDALRTEAESARAEARAVTMRLDELRAEMGQLRSQLAQTRRHGPEADRTASVDPEELQRLRRKIEHLKGVIDEQHENRRELRRQLGATSRAAPVESAATSTSDDEDHPDELADNRIERRGVLVPVFDPASVEAIRDLPEAVAGHGLRTAAALAANDAAAWRGVKRLRGLDRLLSARVGIHHRLLFQLDPDAGEFQVRALVTREALHTTLKRFR